MTPSDSLRAGVVGAAGYVGGELLRLLEAHPHLEVAWATSGSREGEPVHRAHPNLRGRLDLRFSPREAPADDPVDVLFAAVPHGEAAPRLPDWRAAAETVVDLSSDHRLDDPARYAETYGAKHPDPDALAEAVYGVPELHRDALEGADLVAGPGCIASAALLALHPVAEAGLAAGEVTVDAKVGSSAAGATPTPGSHHPERSGALRPYAPAGHRHGAEVEQETGLEVRFTCTAVEAVRGVQATCHVPLEEPLDRRDVWRAYRGAYDDEPFLRLRASRKGLHRLPEPQVLAGSNLCDVGFALDDDGRRLVAVAALDNLVKGAAGAALQSVNAARGWPEDLGLGFPGLHPT